MVAKILDEKCSGIIYSVDLLAAFDLLRPDKFIKLFKSKMSEGLLFAIGDFLTNRKFCINNKNSNQIDPDRGCVQGSILGPKLFSLYVSELKGIVETPEINLVSYADDTYVILTPINQSRIKDLTEKTIKRHVSYLRSICMIVNDNKTKVMWIGNFKAPFESVLIGDNEV
jgi:hypothetical protein